MHKFERDERDGALALPNLARARRERGRSQQDLARISGVSKATITRIETGHRARISSAGKLAEALGTTVSALARGAGGLGAGVLDRERGLPGREARERPPEVVLALASRRAADEDGEGGGLDLVEVLGGADALEDFGRLLDRARAQVLGDVGTADEHDAPRLASGEGLSDEVEAQRNARSY